MRSFIHHTTFGSVSKIWQGIIASRKDMERKMEISGVHWRGVGEKEMAMIIR